MQKGWDATGRLSAYWSRVGGRDGLAEKTGITGSTLSGYNTGDRLLGEKNARRIAKALRITIADLGAPATETRTAEERTVLAHLEELADQVADLGRALRLLAEAQRPELRRQLLDVLAGEQR